MRQKLVKAVLTAAALFPGASYGIFGGTDVTSIKDTKSGFVVSIENQKQELRNCTGSLVHPQVVLTAAHCVRNGSDFLAETQVRIGGFQRGQGQVRTIKRVLLPDQYAYYERQPQKKDYTKYYDMALLLLSEKAPSSADLVTVADELPAGIESVWAMGFGVTGGQAYVSQGRQISIPTGTSRLRRVKLQRDPESEFNNWFISLQNQKGFCHGDSGGPAFVEYDGKWLQIGISSYVTHEGSESCRKRGYFLNLGFIEESGFSRGTWIRQGIESLTR